MNANQSTQDGVYAAVYPDDAEFANLGSVMLGAIWQLMSIAIAAGFLCAIIVRTIAKATNT